MKKNIAFVSIKAQFCKKLCKMFCDKLEMLYADINDILQYNMVNQNMLNAAGKDYFDLEEQKVLKSVATCENIGLNVDFNILNKGENLNIVKQNCLIVYLRYTKDMLEKFNKSTTKQHTKLLIAYDLEDKICTNCANIVVNLTGSLQKDCEIMMSNIKKYYNI